jgi:hypothetical protein
MKIVLHKRSSDRHALEIVRESRPRELVECETRSYLMHDLLHYAVETEAGLAHGFWGNLARGKTLAQMNDRTGQALAAELPELMAIERLVGALSSVTKGRSAAQLAEGLRNYELATGTTPPAWLNEALIVAVQERMRRLVGQWKATAYGAAMELEWPA